ncbi:MAG: M20/M25/M40 family metallo-hydrolase, partial [Thermomicrobiales bacterium]
MTDSPAARVNRDEIVALASRLIATPSTSGEERAVMDVVVRWCEEQGIGYEVVALDPQRPNVIVTLGDGEGGPTVVMNGHLDTVPVSDPASWQSPPFEPTVNADGTKLVGRGASDMKSSVAVMLYVMQLLKDTPIKGRVQVHVVSDEELGGKLGTIFVLDEIAAGRLPRPDYCLIGEKSDLKVRNAERGLLGVKVTIHGRASHTAAARATGVNAIMLASKAILALEKDIDKFHPAIGKP